MTIRRLQLQDVLQASENATITSSAFSMDLCVGFAIVSVATDVTPSLHNFATTDVSTLNSAIVISSHGYATGLKVQFTTTTTLPGGLSLLTDYYMIVTTSSTIRVATSLSNALSGTYVTLTTTGTGTHTVTPTTSIAPVQSLEATIDGVIYAPVSNSNQTLSSIGNLTEYEEPYYSKMRVKHTITSGQWLIDSKIMIKGYDI